MVSLARPPEEESGIDLIDLLVSAYTMEESPPGVAS